MGKKISIKILLLLMFSLLGLSLFFPFQTSLVFYSQQNHELRAYLPIEVDDKFQIIFTHSIHLTDVVEKYEVQADLTIKQYEMVFEEFGIGMPSNAKEGETLASRNGKYHLENMNEIFSSINIRNGKVVSKHRLVWGDTEEHLTYFNDYFKPGERLTVKIDRLSLWQAMRGVKISDEG